MPFRRDEFFRRRVLGFGKFLVSFGRMASFGELAYFGALASAGEFWRVSACWRVSGSVGELARKLAEIRRSGVILAEIPAGDLKQAGVATTQTEPWASWQIDFPLLARVLGKLVMWGQL